MLRLFKYNDCSAYKDFPNDLFRRKDIALTFDFEADKVVIENVEYRLSNILHLSGTGTAHNSLEITQFLGLKTKVKKGLLNLLNNC